jgi:2-hydroxy-3-keto-5-methylthiopentenyl-1-phosphate phosphatase
MIAEKSRKYSINILFNEKEIKRVFPWQVVNQMREKTS